MVKNDFCIFFLLGKNCGITRMIIKYIDLNNLEFASLNLGGIIEKCIEEFHKHSVVRASVQISDLQLRGSYDIPRALGFSTPWQFIKHGILALSNDLLDEFPEPILPQFLTWKKIYGSTNPCRFHIKKYSMDDTVCYMCLKKYSLYDNVIQIDCNHKFHYECLGRHLMKDCTLCDKTSLSIHQGHSEKSGVNFCPMCITVIKL